MRIFIHNPQHDRDTGELVVADTEDDIFDALDKRFYEPHERIR